MEHICVFAGTTEGKEIVHLLSKAEVNVTACVATEYGEVLLDCPNCNIRTGRMNQEEMSQFFAKYAFAVVIDATHPFAEVVTANIKRATTEQGIEYLLVNRGSTSMQNAVYVDSPEQAVEYLNTTTGNVLLTTGSKSLSVFTKVYDYKNRIYPRVLPMESSLVECEKYGYTSANTIAMQGPFSVELNTALLKQYQIKTLVTKDSGIEGGMVEKLKSCEDCGVKALIIKRPSQETGMTLQECKTYLKAKYGICTRPKISIIGLGLGTAEQMTISAERALRECDAIIGADRLLESVRHYNKKEFSGYMNEDVMNIIRSNPSIKTWAVVFSGDIGFYSGAKKLYAELSEYEIEPICGISAPMYLAAKLHLPWQDMLLCSLHGKKDNIISLISRHSKVFTLLGGDNGVHELCNKLCEYGLGNLTVAVGENLSYQNERIVTAKACELLSQSFNGLCCAVVFNAIVRESTFFGIPDENFIRQDKIPMTKAEVRAVSMSKLSLSSDSVVYDIGAGTGSVSIEMALQAYHGKVYAIEKNTSAVQVIHNNQVKFLADNIEIIEGTAPNILEDLPHPTHVFIGGSNGQMKEIVELVLKKNPTVRIVVNTVTLESLAEVTAVIHQYGFPVQDITQVSVTKATKVGAYNLMSAQNPVYICTMQKTV